MELATITTTTTGDAVTVQSAQSATQAVKDQHVQGASAAVVTTIIATLLVPLDEGGQEEEAVALDRPHGRRRLGRGQQRRAQRRQ